MSVMNESSVSLIGFMGSGKSTLGALLAEKINIPFVDLDERIEHFCSLSISEIFELYGEDHFRVIEQQVLKNILKHERPCVIATGGGVPCHFENMDLLNRYTITVYLRLSVTELTSRLQNIKNDRPLLDGLDSEDELQRFIEDMLSERNPYYLRAHYIAEGSLPTKDLVSSILEMIEQYV